VIIIIVVYYQYCSYKTVVTASMIDALLSSVRLCDSYATLTTIDECGVTTAVPDACQYV